MKNQILRLSLIIAFVFSTTFFTYGWGKVGHHIIVDVAKNYVNKNVQDSVSKYFGEMTWESASTWMDEQRKDSQYNYMKQWHYINIEKGNQYDTSIEHGDNVVMQLGLAINNLKNRSNLTKEEINLNLKVLFHLMGDLHNPLHVGYGVDRGGNDIKLTYTGKTFNLHRIWDTDIVEYKKNTAEIVQFYLAKTSHRKIRKMAKGDIIQWLNQTRESLTVVYSYSDLINDDYMDRSYPIVEKQLAMGGVRLGKVLNEIFKN